MKKINEQLLKACTEGDLQKVKELIDKGANVNVKSKYGNTPLIFAAWKGHTEIAKLLIEKGSDVNAKDNDGGNTALIDATRKGHTEVVKLLLDKGADVNTKDDKEYTAISYAFDIENDSKRQEVLELFNYYHPEAFMSEYMDRSVGAGR